MWKNVSNLLAGGIYLLTNENVYHQDQLGRNNDLIA